MTVTVTRTTQFVFKCQIVRTCNLYQKQRHGDHVRPSTQYLAVGHLLLLASRPLRTITIYRPGIIQMGSLPTDGWMEVVILSSS